MSLGQSERNVPSVNLYLENSSEGPLTRNTNSDHWSQHGMEPPSMSSSENAAFVDIRNHQGAVPQRSDEALYNPSFPSEVVAENLDVNYRPVQPQSVEPILHGPASAAQFYVSSGAESASSDTLTSTDASSVVSSSGHTNSRQPSGNIPRDLQQLSLVSQPSDRHDSCMERNESSHNQAFQSNQSNVGQGIISGNGGQNQTGHLRQEQSNPDFRLNNLQIDAVPSDEFSGHEATVGSIHGDPRSPVLKEVPVNTRPGTFTVHGIEVQGDVTIPDGSNVNITISNTDRLQLGSNNTMVINQTARTANTNVTVTNAPRHAAKQKVELQVPKRQVSDVDMQIVADHIGRDWRKLGRELTFTNGQLDNIESDNRHAGQQETTYKMMVKWQEAQESPEAASVKVLVNALVKMKRSDVAVRFQAVKKSSK